jgi:hypothetical protein
MQSFPFSFSYLMRIYYQNVQYRSSDNACGIPGCCDARAGRPPCLKIRPVGRSTDIRLDKQ